MDKNPFRAGWVEVDWTACFFRGFYLSSVVVFNSLRNFYIMIDLSSAPRDARLRIIEIEGGHGVRRRLMALGLHKNDYVKLDSKSILGGPILIRNLNSDTSIAVGREIARSIIVEIVDKE
jgi:Fe2+ transport system protein FeoA